MTVDVLVSRVKEQSLVCNISCRLFVEVLKMLPLSAGKFSHGVEPYVKFEYALQVVQRRALGIVCMTYVLNSIP